MLQIILFSQRSLVKLTYRPEILLVELGTNNRRFHIVLDVGHAWEATERWRECLLHMASGVPGHFDPQTRDVQVRKHAIVYAARIVEWELHSHYKFCMPQVLPCTVY